MSTPAGLGSPPEQTTPESTPTASQKALEAWKRRFPDRQVTLNSTDLTPFTQGRVLGSGGVGTVYKTTIGGTPVALKRIYSRKLTKWHLNEAEVLAHLSEDRHRHIVELIGSYIHRQGSMYELGLLLWPVAECDLGHLLHEFDTAGDAVASQRYEGLDTAVETLAGVLEVTVPEEGDLGSRLHETYTLTYDRLYNVFGCISEAVAYLHRNNIRHKDIKPHRSC